MKFKSIAEAFNHYRAASIEEIETRAVEIRGIIEADPQADIQALNIELGGLKQAKENAISKRNNQNSSQSSEGGSNAANSFNPITGMELRNNLSSEAAGGDIFSSPEYRNAFYKTLLGQSLTETEESVYIGAMHTMAAEMRAGEFNTVSSAAAVLPTATLNEVIAKARTMGGLLPVCRSFNIPSKISVPVGTPSSKASWHTEGAVVDSEKSNVVNVNFSGYEILKVFSISAAARRMSIAAFESYMIDELQNSVIECIADALVNGTGANQGTGILKGVTWEDDVNSFESAQVGAIAYTDITKTVAALKRGYAGGASFAMNNATLYKQIYGLTDGNDRPLFLVNPQRGGIGTILGFPVVVDDNIEGETILFGNFNYMAYNLIEGILIEVSRDSSFNRGLIDYRALAVADCKPIVGEAFVKLSTAATS